MRGLRLEKHHFIGLFRQQETLEVLTVLLDAGADVNARTDTGVTPLHVSRC